MKKIIPILMVVMLLSTGCLRKQEEYKSVRNDTQTESVEKANSDENKTDEVKKDDTAEKTDEKKPEETSENSQNKTMKVTADVLNMRSDMDRNSSVVTKLKKDDQVKVVEEKTDSNSITWVKVDFNGQVGYVVKEYLGE